MKSIIISSDKRQKEVEGLVRKYEKVDIIIVIIVIIVVVVLLDK